jgi:hypothetical protein
MIDHRVVEGPAVRLVLEQGLAVDAENLQPDSGTGWQESVGADMSGAVRILLKNSMVAAGLL